MTKPTIFDFAREGTQAEEKLMELLYAESRDDVEENAPTGEVTAEAVNPEPVDR